MRFSVRCVLYLNISIFLIWVLHVRGSNVYLKRKSFCLKEVKSSPEIWEFLWKQPKHISSALSESPEPPPKSFDSFLPHRCEAKGTKYSYDHQTIQHTIDSIMDASSAPGRTNSVCKACQFGGSDCRLEGCGCTVHVVSFLCWLVGGEVLFGRGSRNYCFCG